MSVVIRRWWALVFGQFRHPEMNATMNGYAEDGEDWVWVTGGDTRCNLWTLVAWLRQGRPRQYPVVVRVGRLRTVSRADATWDVVVEGWDFSWAFVEPGSLSMHALTAYLLERYPGEHVLPSGDTLVGLAQVERPR
jgi:hypothetical protein